MQKKAFLMRVKPGVAAEYEKRHNPIPAELAAELRSHGVTSYSIFLDAERLLLFAYIEFESEERLAGVARTAACQRWWRFMAPLMETNPDGSPQQTVIPQVFDLARQP